MDLQKLVDTMSDMSCRERSNYHLTLGGLIHFLESVPKEMQVITDTSEAVGYAHSYRGYYSDLSFAPAAICETAGELLTEAKDALGHEFEGWKGGEYRMHDKTPLWFAEEGHCGRAIIDAKVIDGKVVLQTKDLGD